MTVYPQSKRSISYEHLPEWTRQHRQRLAGSHASFSSGAYTRRGFLRVLSLSAILAAGLQVFEIFGGHAPVALGAQTCTVTGLTSRPTCNSTYGGKVTTCGNGCARAPAHSSTYYCLNLTFNSRHRTCGEDKDGGDTRFQIRTNECYGGGFDGWRWQGVDSPSGSSCGCANYREFACNDGYVSFDSGGSWQPTICETARCIQLV